MTTTLIHRRAARSIGWLVFLAGACAGVSSAAADPLARQHLCDGGCASCRKPACAQDAGCPPEPSACVRAGDPHRIAWYARPSRNKRDVFGFVGGGTAWRGDPRLTGEGTWGLDYAGVFSKNHLWLKWLHGRPSHQAGGSYNTDGPHFLSP